MFRLFAKQQVKQNIPCRQTVARHSIANTKPAQFYTPICSRKFYSQNTKLENYNIIKPGKHRLNIDNDWTTEHKCTLCECVFKAKFTQVYTIHNTRDGTEHLVDCPNCDYSLYANIPTDQILPKFRAGAPKVGIA